MSSMVSEDAPQPRLCYVKKWSESAGYGFNLHAEKNKYGHHIGSLDSGSPAVAAGLREGDRIVEVNGTNISNENHQQVVARIRAVASEVKLLVMDQTADEYYRERRIVVRGDMAGVVAITTPSSREEWEANPRAGYEQPTVTTTDEPEPSPRLTKLRVWPDFSGYGFNLTSDKAKTGQFIGNVDADSPASATDIREGDRIIEVNGVNVTEETHHQVVSRIKAHSDHVDLLLVDKETDSFYSSRGSVIRGDMQQVVVTETPERGNVTDVSNATTSPAIPIAAEEKPKEEGPSPRLCYVIQWPDFKGYGFNLNAEKGRIGNFIGAVDADSPAHAAGVITGDNILEVNGKPLATSNHSEVVKEITAFKTKVNMLLADDATVEYYKAEGVQINSQMAAVKVIMCPDRKPASSASATASSDIPIPIPLSARAKAELEAKAPPMRLCLVKKWTNLQGYGFNLHDEKGLAGHFIGKVDPDSPADASGLMVNDKLIEVNDEPVNADDHRQVVSRITRYQDEVSLLVADVEADEYFRTHDLRPHKGMANITVIKCPVNRVQSTAATNGVATDNADELEVGEHNGHAYIQPDCQPVREPSPEPEPPTPEVIYRAPTPELPEPVRVPTPEPVRTPSPEHVPVAHVPTPEPVREPSPVPLRQPSPVREVNGVVETVTSTTDTSHVNSQPEVEIVEPLYDVADPIGNIEATDTNRIFIVPPPPPLPEEMNGSHIVTKETEEVHTESIVVSADHEGTMAVSDIAPAADDKISIASSIATSEGSSTAAAGYNVETAELMPETSEVAQSLDIDNANVESSSVTAINQSITVVHYEGTSQVDEGTFKSVIDVSSEQDKLETHNEQDDVTLLSKHYATDPYSCPVEAEVTTDVMTQNSGSQRSRAEDVTVSELAAPSEFNDIRSSSRQSSNSTMSDSATHYDLAVDADGDSASEEVYICDIKHDISEHQPDNHITGSELAKTHVTGGYAAAHGSVPHVSLSPHDAEEPVAQDHISESHMTEHITGGFHTESDVRSEVHVTKGVAVNEYRPPPKPVVMRIPMTSSDSNLVHGKTSDVAPIESSPEGMGGSLQDALSRVKSRKKQQARNGNMSMKDKLELFQQL